MATVNGKKSVTLNGTDPIVINGTQHFEWQDNAWADGFFFWSGQAGSVLTTTLTGNWGLGTLRFSGQLGARINDTNGGDRYIDAILCANEARDVINLKTTYVSIIKTGNGNDRVNIGNTGFEFLSTGNGADNVTINTTHWLGTINLGNGNNRLEVKDRGAGIQAITAGEGNDRITVRSEAEFISSGRGNDIIETGANWIGTINAGRGRDKVVLSKGDVDLVSLGRDADTVIVRIRDADANRVSINGNESVSGPKERDFDTVSFANFRKAVNVDLDAQRADSAQGRLELKNIEAIIGGRAGDKIAGNWDNNRLEGRAGRDQLIAGDGADTMVGGLGADRFIFRDVDNKLDRIADFKRGQNDKIDLREISDDFDFIGRKGFSGDGPEVRFTTGGGQTRIIADRDGDGDADFTIALNQAMNMLERDFLL